MIYIKFRFIALIYLISASLFFELYYKTGQIKSRHYIIDTKMNGAYISYYENGQIKEKGNYVDDKSDGESTWYYENGQLESKI